MPSRIAPADLPDWPAVMAEDLAAAYLGNLSVNAFRTHIRPAVPPIELTPGRQGYRRVDLDRWIAQRAGDTTAPTVTEILRARKNAAAALRS